MQASSLPAPSTPAPINVDKPPPHVDLPSQTERPTDSPADRIGGGTTPRLLVSDTDTISAPTVSPSYFSQPVSSTRPFYPYTLATDSPGLLGPTHTSNAASDAATNMPLPTAPNPHFHLTLASASTAATTGVPQTPMIPTTISRSTTLNLPGFKLQSSATPMEPKLPAKLLGKIPEHPLSLRLSKDDLFVTNMWPPSGSMTPGLAETSIQPNHKDKPQSGAESTLFMKQQAKAAAETATSFARYMKSTSQEDGSLDAVDENLTSPQRATTFDRVSIPTAPLQNLVHYKMRSPSLPVNNYVASIEIPSIPSNLQAISPSEVAEILRNEHARELMLVVDVRPFNQHSNSRVLSAINICIPSTLLRRPAYSFSRFAECMLPSQRGAIKNLARYNTIVFYDQSTEALSTTAHSALAHTIIKLSQCETLGDDNKLSYLTGGFTAFSKLFPNLVDKSPVQVAESKSLFPPNEALPPAEPKMLKLESPSQTSNFTPVLAGFSLPPNSTKDGPLKPFASYIKNNLDHHDSEETEPIGLPDDLDAEETESYFPNWLQDIIKPATGPRHVVRRFHDIEEAEKVRLQSAFSRGSRMASSLSPDMTTPKSTASDEGVSYTFSAGVELGAKNRYSNIWPYDHTRVKLPEVRKHLPEAAPVAPHEANPTSDYFNASYITSKNTSLRYIATQGPLPDTFADFWHVVWDKKIPIIVMLTTETEGGSVKCHKYWNNDIYGAVSLTKISSERVLLSSETKTSVTIRKFVLAPTAMALAKGTVPADSGPKATKESNGRGSYYNPHLSSDSHTVIQIEYSAWPDLGSPAYPDDLIQLCSIKNSYLQEWKDYLQSRSTQTLTAEELSPWTIVHCSAGCGRTGTFCTVDSVIHTLSQQKKAVAADATHKSAVSPFHINLPGDDDEDDKSSAENRDLIYRTVHDFRRQRLSMVQVLRQYVLCYETVILWVHNQYKEQQRKEKNKKAKQGNLA